MKVRRRTSRRGAVSLALAPFLFFLSLLPLSASPEDPILVLPRMSEGQVKPAVSPDGARLAVPGLMGTVMLFDNNTGQIEKTLTGLKGGGWRDVAFTPDGAYLMSAAEAGSSGMHVKVWRTSIWTVHAEIFVASLPHWLRSIAISPDARWLAAGGWNFLKIYDLSTGSEVASLPQPGRTVYSLKFSPDGQYLVSANGGTSAKVWRVSDWSEAATLAEGLSENVSLAFSPDGQYLALATSDKVQVWRSGSWDTPVQTWTYAAWSGELPIAFSQDSQLLAARIGHYTVKVWKVSDWSEYATVQLGADNPYVHGITIRGSTDLFVGSGYSPYRVDHYDIATGAKVKEFHSPVRGSRVYEDGLSFAPDGSLLAVADSYPNRVEVHRVGTWQKELEITPGSYYQVQFAPSGTRLFVGGQGVFRVSDGSRLWASTGSGYFTPDGTQVVVWTQGDYSADYFRLRDSSTGALIRAFTQAGTAIRHVLFTPDGQFMLAPARSMGWNIDNGFRVWRVSDGEIVFFEEWGAETASIDPTGSYLVTGSGKNLAIRSVIPEGGTLRFELLRSWGAHAGDIHGVAFAPTGNVFVSCSEDAGVKIWRLQDGGLERTLRGHVEPVYGVVVAQSGNDLLIAAGGWGGLAVWQVPVPGMGNSPVSVPQLVYPANGAELSDWVLRFKAEDANPTDRIRFRVEIIAPDGTVAKRYDQTVDASSFDKLYAGSDEEVAVLLDPSLPLGTYRWRVQATDGWSWSAWSSEGVFILVKPELPLGQFRILPVNAGGKWRATVTVPQGASKLFLSCRSFEQAYSHKVTLYFGGSKVAEQTGGDILIERNNPSAGEYEVELDSAASGQVAVYAGTELPAVRLGGRYGGTIYHSDGYDWLQLDVPEGVRSLQFTMDAPGNVAELTVWRGSIGSGERWIATHRFNPPVRLTINNPLSGRYYLRVMDHGSLTQSQVRPYTLVLSGAQASLTAAATPGMASAGSPDPITFTIQYANTGEAPASSTQIICVLPEGLSVVDGSITPDGTYDPDTRTIRWNLGDLSAGAQGSTEFRAVVGSSVPEGTNLTVSARIESPDLAEAVSEQVAVWVGAAGVTFDNIYTAYNFVNVTVRGLAIDRNQGTPRVWLDFPAGTATSTQVDAEEVHVSEDGTQVQARFALINKVLQNVAPKLKLTHPSVGSQEWQAPTLQVFDMGANLSYNKTFVRQGRRETFNLRVTNPNGFWETPFVKLQLGLENVPAGQTITINYWVYGSDGSQKESGQVISGTGEVLLLLPQLAPYATADYRLVVQVSGSRSQIRSRIEPMTIAVVTIVSGVAIVGSWVGHNIIGSECERRVKARLREELLDRDGFPLDDEQINRLYEAYRKSTSFAAEWLAQAASGATEQAIKDLVVAKYGEKFTKAAELAYKVGKGDHPMDMLLSEIASQLAPGLDWPLLPATTAVKAFLAEGQNCIETSKQLRDLAKRLTKRNQNRRYRVTSSWDPNAKSGTFGVDGFIPDGQVIDYTIFFENLSTATASAEEVLIEDMLDENLDGDALQFTGFGFGSHEVTLSTPTNRLSQGVDLGNNLVVLVESSYDPSTRKLTVRFKGIDTRTGEHYEDGFLPPNNNEPEGEGYVSFRIRPKSDTPSGTRIVNTATITFDPHLGQNPPMTTNEHALTLDKQAPTVQVASLAEFQSKPIFNVQWQGEDDASGVEYAEIWYSEDGGPFRLWQTLAPGETRQQTGSATFRGKFGYTYRFYAVGNDRVGNRAGIPVDPHATTTAGVAPEVPSGLQLIALPVTSEAVDARSILSFEADKLAIYDPVTASYVRYPNASLQIGRGYWVQLPASQRPSIRGEVVDEAQPFAVSLQRGWNLVGNPWLEALAWDLGAILVEVNGERKSLRDAQTAGWVEDYAWGWDGGKYVLVYDRSVVSGVQSELQAWKGYWLYAHQPCTLILPTPAQGRQAQSRSAVSSRSGWSLPLRLQAGGSSAEVTIGIVSQGRGISVGLPPQPPTANGQPARLTARKGGQELAADVRSGTAKQTWDITAEWAPLVDSASSGKVMLTFGSVASVPRRTNLWLVDKVTGKRHYLRTTAVYSFTPAPGENSRRFQVIAEPDSGASLRILGVRATRTRGGAFSVEFNLTQPAAVTAEVKDAGGRTVARLTPFGGRAVEGWQSLTWRGTDEAGVHLPSGAYLLTLTASDEEGRVTRATIPVVLTR